MRFAAAALIAVLSFSADAKQAVRIAFVGPLTGGNSAIGLGGRNSADLAVRLRNADPKAKYQLSKTALHYTGGILRHARAFVAVTNPLVNSYKRLVPGYEAPVYAAWSQRNRSALVRVPMYQPGKEKATRCELRW